MLLFFTPRSWKWGSCASERIWSCRFSPRDSASQEKQAFLKGTARNISGVWEKQKCEMPEQKQKDWFSSHYSNTQNSKRRKCPKNLGVLIIQNGFSIPIHQKKSKKNLNWPAINPQKLTQLSTPQNAGWSKARHRLPNRARNDPPCRRSWAPPSSYNTSPTVKRCFTGTREMGNGWKVNEGQALWLRCSKRGLARKNHRKNEILWKEWTIQRSKTLFLEAWIRQNHYASWRTRTSNLVQSLFDDSHRKKPATVGTNGVSFVGPATLGHGRTDVGNRTLSAAAPRDSIPAWWWPIAGKGHNPSQNTVNMASWRLTRFPS